MALTDIFLMARCLVFETAFLILVFFTSESHTVRSYDNQVVLGIRNIFTRVVESDFKKSNKSRMPKSF